MAAAHSFVIMLDARYYSKASDTTNDILMLFY